MFQRLNCFNLERAYDGCDAAAPARPRRFADRSLRSATPRSPRSKSRPSASSRCFARKTRSNTSVESGLITVNGALIGTTLTDIFSINPATWCTTVKRQTD
jgi:hypothetical protein